MSDPTDLDVRIAALTQEYAQHVAQLSGRAATLASELASAQASLKAAQEKLSTAVAEIAELTQKELGRGDGQGT